MKIEYNYTTYDESPTVSELNILGEDGWVVISITRKDTGIIHYYEVLCGRIKQKNINVVNPKIDISEFIDSCISSGKYIECGLNLRQIHIVEIEHILYTYSDIVAERKIRKLIKTIK